MSLQRHRFHAIRGNDRIETEAFSSFVAVCAALVLRGSWFLYLWAKKGYRFYYSSLFPMMVSEGFRGFTDLFDF